MLLLRVVSFESVALVVQLAHVVHLAQMSKLVLFLKMGKKTQTGFGGVASALATVATNPC
jgi:hypothetical protein